MIVLECVNSLLITLRTPSTMIALSRFTAATTNIRSPMNTCTIVAFKIKGTAREIYILSYISLQWGFSLYTPRVGIQGKSLQVKPLKESRDRTPHSKHY